MPDPKNRLTEIIPHTSKEIAKLLKATEETYRFDKTPLFYDRVLCFPRKNIGSDDFIKLVYETLQAFNMDGRGARLSEYSVFKKSIKKHREAIASLDKYKLEKLDRIDDNFKNVIGFLFDNLQLTQTNSPLVTFSKTMHFFLPDLFMPIDRKYTIQFFYKKPPYKRKNYGLPEPFKNQKQSFFQVFEQFREFSHKHREILKSMVDSDTRWNRNIPKIVDNLIIAYVNCHMEQ